MTYRRGFTIVELIVVIVVLGILATVTAIGLTGYLENGRDGKRVSNVTAVAEALERYYDQHGEYPSCAAMTTDGNTVVTTTLKGLDQSTLLVPEPTAGVTNSFVCGTTLTSGGASGDFYQYVDDGTAACTGSGACTSFIIKYRSEQDQTVKSLSSKHGLASDGSLMQAINSSSCSASRTRAVDARDNHSYWIQQLADGKCWMLTNLAYAGGTSNGGVSTYGDVKTLTDGTGGSMNYTTANYYVVPSTTNYTIEPSLPSTTTDGGATNSQYGYLYNWCGAMAGQATSACANATTPTPDTTTTVCPAGWRLPTGQATTGELTLLNNAVNGGSTSSDLNLRTTWLEQRSGYWGFGGQGSSFYFWSSTQSAAGYAYSLTYLAGTINPSNSYSKQNGMAVRCVTI